MAAKSKAAGRQHKALLAQGRCFKCYKKGHVAKACSRKPPEKSYLDDLPVEILELICEELTGIGYDMHFVRPMLSLRLTCRKINNKTHDYFGRTAFRVLGVSTSYRGLQQMSEISESAFARKVEHILFSQHEDTHDDYMTAQDTATSLGSSRRAYRAAEKLLVRVRREQDEKAFIERSGTLGIRLTLALLKMPNIHGVYLYCVDDDKKSVRKEEIGHGESTTQMFSTIVSSLGHAAVKPRRLKVLDAYERYEPISLQALCMPRTILNCLSELQHLKLTLETKDNHYRRMTPVFYNHKVQ